MKTSLKTSPFLVFLLSAASWTPFALAQNLELTPDSGLNISADGICWDDCSVQITPIGDGAVVAILKNGSVVDQEFTNAPLQEGRDDAPTPPPEGTGPVSEGEHYYGENDDGQMGSYQRTTTWNYENYVLKNVSCVIEFVPMDPPDEGDDGAGSGGSGG